MTALRLMTVGMSFLCVILLGNSLKAETFDKKAEVFIQSLSDRALTSFRTQKDELLVQEEFRGLLNEAFDVRAIGKWVLGRYWRKAEEAEKEEYLSLFEDFIVATYASRFKDFSGEEISFKVIQSVAKNGNDAIVRSQVDRPRASEPLYVDWRVKGTSDQELKIVDVLIAGVSMSQAQRSEFASVIKRNGGKVSGLISALKDKTDDILVNVNKTTN